MSHLDDLDEYEAELELRLKKEYQAVFSLFRYCVLTQDATYLCNRLERSYVPQQAYPFFQLKLEDVWVWDKNRPTRMIPRTEIYTSGDVTIEELRGEGDEPAITADALAERIGERLPTDDDL
jgi:Arc/MetJ family transcription regulator